MHPRQRLLTALLLLTLVMTGPARAQSAPAPSPSTEQPAPKFIWGMLIDVAFKLAMTAFTEWLGGRVSSTQDLRTNESMNKLVLDSTSSVVVSLTSSALGLQNVGGKENVVANKETKPIEVQGGRENYQGVHVALAGFDRQGNFTELRPVNAGFRSGDRIKLKVLPTFDGLLVIENITPRGERRQIYPPAASQAIQLKAGVEVLVPAARNQFFEFAGATGDEQLIITLRDPRAVGAAESKTEVSRQDSPEGSNFVQETPAGTYPVISQSLKFRHGP